ncbi:MAG: 2OG-Fe(II) oxygenase [Bdellovibrionales bacterium]
MSFNFIADRLSEDQHCIVPDFFSIEETNTFSEALKVLQSSGDFQKARVGRNSETQLQETVRGDQICWMNSEEPLFASYFKKMELVRNAINEKLFLGAYSLDAHFVSYEAGAHRDAFSAGDSRLLSTVCYLNEDWKDSEGGQLKLYLENKIVEVFPQSGTMVCFFSQTQEHEVLPATRERLSIAGWFKRA